MSRAFSCGYQVVGCEPSADALPLAQRAVRDLAFYSFGVEDGPSALGNDSFDVAIAAEVIEHLVKPRDLLRFARQLLRPGDHLIISTPYHGYLKNLVLALGDKWDAHLNPFWGWRHHWSRKTLSQLLNETAFSSFGSSERSVTFLCKSMIVVAQKLPSES